jgi:hypothetical protein
MKKTAAGSQKVLPGAQPIVNKPTEYVNHSLQQPKKHPEFIRNVFYVNVTDVHTNDIQGATPLSNQQIPKPEPDPEIVQHLKREELEGKFSKLRGSFLSAATSHYRDTNKRRFKHVNPRITAPGEQVPVIFDVDETKLANSYMRIVTTAHGEYVEIQKQQLAIPVSEFTACPPSKLTGEYQWLGFVYKGHNIYWAGLVSPMMETKKREGTLCDEHQQSQTKIQKT